MKPNFRFALALSVFGMLILLSCPGELWGQQGACVVDDVSFIPKKCDGDQDGYLKNTNKCLEDYNCPTDCDDSNPGMGLDCTPPSESPGDILYITTSWEFPYAPWYSEQVWTCKREVGVQHGRYYRCPYEGLEEQIIPFFDLSEYYVAQLLKGGDDTLCGEESEEWDWREPTTTGMLLGFSDDCGLGDCQSGAHMGFSIDGYNLNFVATDYSVVSQNADPFTESQDLEMEEIIITFRKAGTRRKVAQCQYLIPNEDMMILYVDPAPPPEE